MKRLFDIFSKGSAQSPDKRWLSDVRTLVWRLRAAILLIFLPFLLTAAEDHGITLTLSSASVQPGDLIELRAKMRRPEYAEFVFSMPPHAQLRRVSVEAGVVQLNDGMYEQEHLWLLQAVASGDVVLDEVQAQVKQGGQVMVYALPILKLQILPYASLDALKEPADLSSERVIGSADYSSLIWIILFMIVAVAIYYRIRKSASPEQAEIEPDPFGPVVEKLKQGLLPIAELENILEGLHAGASQSLRHALEDAVYARRGNAEQLAGLLEQHGLGA